jgi:predicted ATPase
VAHDAILGREEELAAIARFIEQDRSGSRAFLLEGEAGIGKTTLWREGVRLAESKGLVLASRASEVETRLSFTILGDLLALALAGALEELPAGQRGALEATLLLGPPASFAPRYSSGLPRRARRAAFACVHRPGHDRDR